MALLNPAVLEGVRLVVRQAVETTASSASSTSTPASTSAATTTAPFPPADTSVNGTPSSPAGNNPPNTNGNSPLLFFVALGFGVVFTNLWIIVGVKYCFRYNARNRAMRVNEDGEPITLENMPRPHRRRREKKLMTMDEVNEKFPMQKYKSWVASRAQHGLPTRGGVDVPPSRAGSVRSVQGVIPDLASKERSSTEDRPTTSAEKPKLDADTAAKHEAKQSTSGSTTAGLETDDATAATVQQNTDQQKATRNSESEEEDEHINAALPPEFMTSGDTCAICIDSLDDDEDVRGLTCGHAFHAVCVDPWLTSRRACCPLCKADYYTPKPRPVIPDGITGADGTPSGVVAVTLPENGGRRADRQSRSQSTWMSFRSRGRSNTNSGNNGAAQPQQSQRQQSGGGANANSDSTPRSGGFLSRFRPAAQPGAAQQTPTQTATPSQPTAQTGGFLSNLRLPFGRGQQQESAAAANPTTPSQLEAGTAAPAR